MRVLAFIILSGLLAVSYVQAPLAQGISSASTSSSEVVFFPPGPTPPPVGVPLSLPDEYRSRLVGPARTAFGSFDMTFNTVGRVDYRGCDPSTFAPVAPVNWSARFVSRAAVGPFTDSTIMLNPPIVGVVHWSYICVYFTPGAFSNASGASTFAFSGTPYAVRRVVTAR